MLHWKTAHVPNNFSAHVRIHRLLRAFGALTLTANIITNLDGSSFLQACPQRSFHSWHINSKRWPFNSTGGLINFPSDVTYSITHPVRTVHCLVSKHTANGTECCVQQFADIQLRNLYSFCCYPQDVNLSINLQRAATFGWHLTSNKDQTAVFPPEIAQSHSYFTRSRGVSKSSITLVKQLTALRWHHEFIAHKQVMLGWIGTVVWIMKNTTRSTMQIVFQASSIQMGSPPRSWSVQVTVSFSKMNGDISREMLRKKKQQCAILCSGGHSNFILDSTRGICWGRIFKLVGQANLWKGLDLWHRTGPWGKTRNRWLLQRQTKLYKTLTACLMTICFHLSFLMKVRVM